MVNSILKNLESNIQGQIFCEKEFRKFYSVDASSYQIIPKIVIIPKNEKDIINTIKIAKKFRTSVTVRGAGTGLVGSALNEGIILDLKKFDSIRFDKKHVTVGAGVLKGRLDKEIEKTDIPYWYPKNVKLSSTSDAVFVDELFTRRSLIAFSILHKTIRDIMLFTFSGTLVKVNRTFVSTTGNHVQGSAFVGLLQTS